ncbi:MAG: TetR/AcrR family transcriptional regulator [Pyrinomonadaceae bacterium]|nr:TetR/AcrR family transcriptional regulator [Pyrinomonadaceae bacterium]
MIAKTAKSNNKLIQKGIETRNGILDSSVNLASAEGLEGLTIGRLAKILGMSKSGLFSHFGSKEDLQVATVRRARDVFIKAIVTPANDAQRGLVRLEILLENWIRYVETSVFEGGCFFFAVSAEMDDRPGRVRDLIAHLTMSWVTVIEDEIKKAIELGQLRQDSDFERMAYQFHGFVQEANWFFRLHNSVKAFGFARSSIKETIDNHKI